MEYIFGELVTETLGWGRHARTWVKALPKLKLASASTPHYLMPPHIDEEVTSSHKHGAAAIQNETPTLDEIIQLTRCELTTAQENDPISECGYAAISLLRTNPALCIRFAYQKLHDVPYKEVRTCWRRLHTDATLWGVLDLVESRSERLPADWADGVVRLLDMTLILASAPNREGLIELWFAALEDMLSAQETSDEALELFERPAKRLRLDNISSGQSWFPTTALEPPLLRHPVSRINNMSMSSFQMKVASPATHTPLIIENAIQHWPALAERPWCDPSYLLKRTLGGRRLVPIETGRSYTDSGWGQQISTFKDFLSTYMLQSDGLQEQVKSADRTGYLAQHDLFAQIPSLRADISIPDFCYSDPAPNLPPNVKETPKLEDPLLNAWFGPKGTISPLHTDPYHNILAQVVGHKYVRLYAPGQTKWLYPRSVDENGVDMSNTSQVDLDEAMEAFPEIGIKESDTQDENGDALLGKAGLAQMRDEFESAFPGFAAAEYVEGLFGPGDCLYIPPGWWHYVRSLSPSFSVSFWFN